MSHATKVTPIQAFDSFVVSVLTSPHVGTTLRIKNNITPTLGEDEGTKSVEELRTALIVTVVLVAFVVLFVAMFLAGFFRRRAHLRNVNKRIEAQIGSTVADGFDNNAISLEDIAGRTTVS